VCSISPATGPSWPKTGGPMTGENRHRPPRSSGRAKAGLSGYLLRGRLQFGFEQICIRVVSKNQF
jgi:hypothetical protein